MYGNNDLSAEEAEAKPKSKPNSLILKVEVI